MFASPEPFCRIGGPEPNILNAGSLPAVNLSCRIRRGGRDKTELFELALAELEALAGALLPVLLAFLHARIAGQKAILAQARAQFRIEERQRAGKPHAHRARLSADAAAVHGCDNINGARGFRKLHRLDGAIAPGHIAKIFVRRPSVNSDLARPKRQKDARNGFLAPAGP